MEIQREIPSKWPGEGSEWRIVFDVETEDEQIEGFDCSIAIGQRWGLHSDLILGSAFLSKDESTTNLLPFLKETRQNAFELMQAMLQAIQEIDKTVDNILENNPWIE